MCHPGAWINILPEPSQVMCSAPRAASKPASGTSRLDRRALLSIYALAVIIALIPLAVIDIPLLADYPNHLARMHILGNVDGDLLLSERYASDFGLIPNLAMDVIVPWLTEIMPLDLAGRLFLALILLSTLMSIAILHRVLFNYWSIWPVIAVLFLYHGSFMAGMVNFSLGAGLVPGALALWIVMRHASTAKRLLAGGMAALALFFCHIIAFGAYGILIIAHESMLVWKKWRRTRGSHEAVKHFLIAGTTGLFPALLFMRQLLSHDLAGDRNPVIFGTWSWKAKALLSPLANYNLTIDLISLALLTSLAVWSWCSGHLEVKRRMVLGLSALVVCFALAPKAFLSGGVFDQRFAILFILVLIASLDFRGGHAAARIGLFTLLAALFLVRIGVVTINWHDHRDDLREVRLAIGMIERGSRILVVQPDKTTGIRLAPDRHIVFHHAAQMANLATLAIIEKSAFVSSIYALPGQQPLRLRKPFDDLGGHGASMTPTLADLALAFEEGGNESPPQIRSWQRDFDYVLLIYGYGQDADLFRRNLPFKTLLDGNNIDLFKITSG